MEGKLPLPTKTKIAAWWMIVIGGIGLIGSIAMIIYTLILTFIDLLHPQTGESTLWGLVWVLFVIIVSLLPSLLLFLPGLFLLKKKKWAWWFGIGATILLIVFSYISIPKFGTTSRFLLPTALLPLILLLLDRKNFWLVAK